MNAPISHCFQTLLNFRCTTWKLSDQYCSIAIRHWFIFRHPSCNVLIAGQMFMNPSVIQSSSNLNGHSLSIVRASLKPRNSLNPLRTTATLCLCNYFHFVFLFCINFRRCVPTYGEGDDCSILTDLIYFSNDKTILFLGDDDGHMQMAYAGNAAVAIWSAVCRLLSQSTSLNLNESFEEELGDLLTSAESSFRFHQESERVFEKSKLELYAIKEEDENLEGYRARHNTVRTSIDVDSESKTDIDENLTEEGEVFEQGDCTKQGFNFEIEDEPQSQNLDFSIINDSKFSKNDRVFEVILYFKKYPETNVIFQIFLINDETPKKTVYSTYGQLLYVRWFLYQQNQILFMF